MSKLFAALLLLGAGRGRPCEEPYFSFCTAQCQIGVDLEAELVARGFDCVGCGGSFGGNDLVLRGSRKALFRAREAVLRGVVDQGWRVGWPADSIVIQPEWEQLGWDRGPWCRVAGVQHRVTPTERVLSSLERDRTATYFYFGATADLVFVRVQDAEKAARSLGRAGWAGVEVFSP